MLGWLKRRGNEGAQAVVSKVGSPTAAALRAEGNAWLDKGDLANAEACYRKAVATDANDPLSLINLAYALDEQQRFAEARLNAEKATHLAVDSVDAFYVLASAQAHEADWTAAKASLERVLEIDPSFGPAFATLCRVLAELGLFDQARAIVRQGLSLNRRSGELYFCLGNVEIAAGNASAAVSSYREAVALLPGSAEAHQNLGRALLAVGHQVEAVDSLRRGAAVAPTSASAHTNLGWALQQIGQYDSAAKSYHAALALTPNDAKLHDALGAVSIALGDKSAAARWHRQAIALEPTVANFHSNLGMALNGDEALACFREALRLDPRFAVAHSNIGVTLYEQGDIAGAVESFRAAIALEPERLDFRSKLLFVSSFDARCSPAQYRTEAEAYGSLASSLAASNDNWPPAARLDEDSPLRVGLVSGDFRAHPVGHFLEAVIAHLPAQRIKLIAYTTDPREDELTARIRPHFARWRSLVGLSDEVAARTIRDDGVDVLIDLAGHTAFNRLPIFAWRPAPVQVSWLGYFASTGVRAIDYVMADPHCLPPQDEDHFTERVWRLPEIRYCFTPPSPAPEVATLPAFNAGHLTFGSFQKLAKLSDATLDLWSAVLRALPTARLRIQNAQLAHAFERNRLLGRFATRSIDVDRIDLHGSAPRQNYLTAYGEVDVLLDSFPYTGGTTTCEAMWMGVPTVTMDGCTMLTRQGASLMRTVGLEAWVAPHAQAFVGTTLERVRDLEELAALRLGLRRRAQESALFDAPRFAANLGSALHRMASDRRLKDGPSRPDDVRP